jgi:hypothetical protein
MRFVGRLKEEVEVERIRIVTIHVKHHSAWFSALPLFRAIEDTITLLVEPELGLLNREVMGYDRPRFNRELRLR